MPKKKSASRLTTARDEDRDTRLLQAEERFRLFMENVKEYGIFVLDPTGRVIDWNAGAENILGYGAEIVGQPFAIFFPPDDRENGVPEGELRRAAESGQSSDDRWHVRKNGTYFWAYGVTTALRDEKGALKGFAKVLRDSTERKRFEEQLRDKNKALEEADRLKDEFLAMLSHELRNPLAPIFNGLSVLRRKNADSDLREQAMSIIERQAQSLARLVDDLLDVSRVSQGKIELRRTLVDLVAIARTVVDAIRPAIDMRSHGVTVAVPTTPVWIDADQTRIEQVVTNLLNNAIKYTADGGSVAVTLTTEKERAKLTVRDTGVGIAADLLPRIFDLFVQGDRSIGRSQGGLGVGLTLVKKLVELHGGTVQASSAGLGEGSEFVIWLPLYVKAETPASEGSPATRQLPPVSPLRILVVDDNADAADSIAMVLALVGHDVRTVHDSTLALSAALEHQPDVIFVDIGMPGLNGYEVAARLTQRDELKAARLVAITGYGHETAREQAMQAGFAEHLVKPVNAERLEELLRNLLPASR